MEVEDGNGKSVNVGEWSDRPDGYRVLNISTIASQPEPTAPREWKDGTPYVVQWLPACQWRVVGEREGILRGPGLPKEGILLDEFKADVYAGHFNLGFEQGRALLRGQAERDEKWKN